MVQPSRGHQKKKLRYVYSQNYSAMTSQEQTRTLALFLLIRRELYRNPTSLQISPHAKHRGTERGVDSPRALRMLLAEDSVPYALNLYTENWDYDTIPPELDVALWVYSPADESYLLLQRAMELPIGYDAVDGSINQFPLVLITVMDIRPIVVERNIGAPADAVELLPLTAGLRDFFDGPDLELLDLELHNRIDPVIVANSRVFGKIRHPRGSALLSERPKMTHFLGELRDGLLERILEEDWGKNHRPHHRDWEELVKSCRVLVRISIGVGDSSFYSPLCSITLADVERTHYITVDLATRKVTSCCEDPKKVENFLRETDKHRTQGWVPEWSAEDYLSFVPAVRETIGIYRRSHPPLAVPVESTRSFRPLSLPEGFALTVGIGILVLFLFYFFRIVS